MNKPARLASPWFVISFAAQFVSACASAPPAVEEELTSFASASGAARGDASSAWSSRPLGTAGVLFVRSDASCIAVEQDGPKVVITAGTVTTDGDDGDARCGAERGVVIIDRESPERISGRGGVSERLAELVGDYARATGNESLATVVDELAFRAQATGDAAWTDTSAEWTSDEGARSDGNGLTEPPAIRRDLSERVSDATEQFNRAVTYQIQHHPCRSAVAIAGIGVALVALAYVATPTTAAAAAATTATEWSVVGAAASTGGAALLAGLAMAVSECSVRRGSDGR